MHLAGSTQLLRLSNFQTSHLNIRSLKYVLYVSDGEYIINPSYEQQAQKQISTLWLVLLMDSVTMVEGEMKEVSEEEMAEAIKACSRGYQSTDRCTKTFS